MTSEQYENLLNLARELMTKTKDSNHDWAHIERVILNAKKIKKLLSLDDQKKIDDKILTLTIAWHDVSFSRYQAGFRQSFFEGRRVKKIARRYFLQARLPQKEVDLLCDIIRHHPFSFFFNLNRNRSLYHQILQDADTIDMFNPARLANAKKAAENSWFWKIVVYFLEPLTRKWYLKHKKFIYNQPDIIEKLEKAGEIVIS